MISSDSKVNLSECVNDLYELSKDNSGQCLVIQLFKEKSAVGAHRPATHMLEPGLECEGLMSGPPIISSRDGVSHQ